MNIKKLTLTGKSLPERLWNIPTPPRQLFTAGAPLEELLRNPSVAIVGTRKISPYGQRIAHEFAQSLASQGVVIISGLALGVDAAAHTAALGAGGRCIAILPGPLDDIVPARNRPLARQILEQGGALVSEYGPGSRTFKQNFVARNRLVSGLSDALFIPEAGRKSGSLHTANFAVEQGRDIFVTPGSIYAPGSVGTINLLKQSQAAPVVSPVDILEAMGIKTFEASTVRSKSTDPLEQTVLRLMEEGVSEGSQLLERSGLDTSAFNRTLTMLEISGKVRPLGADQWAIRRA